MKTVQLGRGPDGILLGLELDEFELITLVAMVEEGRKRLDREGAAAEIHRSMGRVADEFMSLLGHLDLVASNDDRLLVG